MTLSVAVAALARAAALPTIVALTDPAQPTAAALGHDRLLAATGAGPGSLVFIAGGGFSAIGADSNERAAKAAALLDAAGADVVNLAHRDLAGDAGKLAAAIASAKAKFVSASFKLPGGAKTPWRNVVFVDRAGTKIAVIGLAATSSSAQSDTIPRLVYVQPKEALAQALTEVGNASGVIVLADMPLVDVARLAASSPKVDLFVVSGRGGGTPSVPGQPRIVRAPVGGGAAAVIDAAKGTTTAILTRPGEPSAEFRALAATWDVASLPVVVTPTPLESVAAPLPTALPSGRVVSLNAGGRNRAARLTIKSAGLLDRFGDAPAPPGARWLVIDTLFENVLTPQLVRDRQVPVRYQVAQVYDNLYVVSGGRVLPRHEGDALPGELPPGKLELPRMGARAGGKLVLGVPADFNPADLTLRFYDFARGHIIVPLLAGRTPAGQPLSPPKKNEVLEAAVFNVNKTSDLGGVPAPAGMTYLRLDLRARSVMELEADATAHDPAAKPGQKMKLGTVADWKESRKYAQLVVDGAYGYAPLAESSSLPPEPRFLPDQMTGGTLTFLVPEKYQSLELRCDFPNATDSVTGAVIRPTGLTLAIEGRRPVPPARAALLTIDDEPFVVHVIGQSTPRQLGQAASNDASRLLLLEFSVKNTGKNGEFFQTREQLKHAGESGEIIEFDKESQSAPHPPSELMWIPPGEQRTFSTLFLIPPTETRPRLAYSAVNQANSKVVALPALSREATK